MKWLFSTLIALLFVLVVALFAYYDPGYVLVQWRDWIVESSLALVVAVLLGAVILFYLVLRLGGHLLRLPRRLRDWRRRHAARRAQAALVRGYLDLYTGRYPRAEQRLSRYAGYGDTVAVLNYLGAARAAQAQGADERRDRYLELARESTAEAEPAAALTRAELLLDRGQYGPALADLSRVREGHPKNVVMLRQLLRLYRETRDWEPLLELLPALRKQHVVDPVLEERLQVQAYRALLAHGGGHGGEQALGEIWRRVPKALAHRPELVREYARRLIACGAPDQAETVLYRSVTREWSPELIYLYGLVEGSQPERQLRRAEEWLVGHETDPVLLLTVGRLCRRSALWGKARQYLESCIRSGGAYEAYHELAGVLEKIGERETALVYYRRGLALKEAEAERLAWTGAP
ncbi:MAG: heme biosynthesis protein HemY [Gammaproteobacteria bacterium]|nr:heme biosynthesis protein HemY [Gammaproteobacteria bacterium]